jgi:hypothetical protein
VYHFAYINNFNANICAFFFLILKNYSSIMNTKVNKCLKNDNEVFQLKNSRGYTVQDRLTQDIEYAKGTKNKADRTLLATKALGAVDLAVEFGLITYKEWEIHIENIFAIA